MLFDRARNVSAQLKNVHRVNTAICEKIYAEIASQFPSAKRDIVIELFGFLYTLCDYFAARNKVKPKYRGRMYRSYGRHIIYARDLKGEILRRTNVDDYLNYRIEIYSKLLNANRDDFGRALREIVDYQVELFLSIIRDAKLSIYDPTDKVSEDRQKAVRDEGDRAALAAILERSYAGIMPGFEATMRRELTDELFAKADSVFRAEP